MGRHSLSLIPAVASAAGLLAGLASDRAYGQGYLLPSAGAVNGGMAGAGAAAPLDANGALRWNPASITAVGNRVDLGLELINVRAEVESNVGPFGGSTASDSGVAAVPAVSVVYAPCDEPWAIGLGVDGTGGFQTNYPASLDNPVFLPEPFGFGAVYSRLSILQISPTVAYRVTDTISVGVAPTISAAELQADPFPFDGPNQNFAYPEGMNGRTRWGGGVQAGVYHRGENGVDLGLSVKSPQWFETFEFNSVDAFGLPRTLTVDYEVPMIVSAGTAYRGIDRLTLAADVRYIDYDSTALFGDPAGIDAAGAVTGLGWESVFVTAVGAQYELTERFALRTGYSYSQNPIRDELIVFNLQAPAIHQHIYALGGSFKLTESVVVDLAWQHLFENTAEGPLHAAGVGAVPFTGVRVTESVDAIMTQLSILF